ncbi:hypothetical protein GCM10011571_15710 [Marinithermofilum abyssi]|uniref:Uncharacterized protein n=2 Tax=Marinithermofilum abyssi TaxID=1571185 RepID=A0A8J2VBW3_9BACL|nr:hypothetical protein GCM10011571_15710 [Marinithermofilum abyssi]
MSYKKLKGVSFDMADPTERELCELVERTTRDFSGFVKQLLLAWQSAQQPSQSLDNHEESIRNSGLPFG